MPLAPKPPKPLNEQARLEALKSYDILYSDNEQVFDDITKLAAYICGTPMALITFIDDERQWFKSKIGLDGSSTTRDEAFCAYAIHQSNVMIVSDPTTDKRFESNPLVTSDPNIRFYAGAPLMTQDGFGLGTLCVIDDKKKELSDAQIDALDKLRNIIVYQLELRKAIKTREKNEIEVKNLEKRVEMMIRELNSKNAEFSDLSKVLSHDLRAPLRGITSLAEWLLEDYESELNDDIKEKIQLIQERTRSLNNLLDAVIEYANGTKPISDNKPTNIETILSDAIKTVAMPERFKVDISGEWPILLVDKQHFTTIFELLLIYAVNNNDNNEDLVEIKSRRESDSWLITFKEYGRGISDRNKEKIFQLFESKLAGDDEFGVGLSLVKKNIELYGGTVKVHSEQGKWTEFELMIPSTMEVN